VLLNILVNPHNYQAFNTPKVILGLMGFLLLMGCGNKAALHLPADKPFAQPQETSSPAFEQEQTKLNKDKQATEI